MKQFKHLLAALVLTLSTLHAQDGWDFFDSLTQRLEGAWVLSSVEAQKDTDSYKHPAVLPLAGTQKVAIAFKLIGGEVTLQEDLLPNTSKQMATMYHCADIECTAVKATHYCVKQNQPEFFADMQNSTPERIVFECDMRNVWCASNEDHVHRIIHELSQNGTHLKTSYLSFENGTLKNTHSIYHFDRK